MLKPFIVLVFISISFYASAQRITAEEYIEQYKDIAIREMKRMGVPASITLAQGILETENGNSNLVKNSNNHFGIKCKNTWSGGRVSHDDDAKGECFRSYKTAEDSYRDHSNFLRGNGRYRFLFDIDATDYRGWAYGLKKAGYATNPKYPEILIKHIEKYNLQQYTLAAIDAMPHFDASKYEDDKEEKIESFTQENNNQTTAAVSVSSNTINSPAENRIDIPDKIITINKSKCLFAKKGTSLLAIAIQNNVNLGDLLEYNDLQEDGILTKDQYIFLEKKSKICDKDFCLVQPGETLHDIAQKNGIQLKYLAEYNKLNVDDVVRENTRLFLQPIQSR